MKTVVRVTKLKSLNKMKINPAINESQKHPYLEKKLKNANTLLKKAGLPNNW